MSQTKFIRFSTTNGKEFYQTLKTRVDDYFTTNKISKFGNYRMYIKTAAMIAMYLVPFFFLLFGGFSSNLVFFLLWVIMGIGMAGIGLSVMHDANHGAYSKNSKVNKVIGMIITAVGGHATNWKIQHNVLHHTFTNVDGIDQDLENGSLMRFSPNQDHKGIHRFQFIYAWFLYGFMTISWMTSKDFVDLIKFNKQGLLKTQKTNMKKELKTLIIHRSIYFTLFLILPLVVIGNAWWMILLGFFTMHFVAGFILACIFQTAHVMESCDFAVPTDNKIDRHWAVHQLLNTCNYSGNSNIFSWFAGGLNFQIEHHLFPNICHIHYKKLSKIVRKTAKEYNLPYNSSTTFVGALWIHMKTLWILGRPNLKLG